MNDISRRAFFKAAGGVALGVAAYQLGGVSQLFAEEPHVGSKKVRSGTHSEAIAKVYFTKKIDAESLLKLYSLVNEGIYGKVAIKLHTGEPKGPNIIPRAMVKALQSRIPNSNIVETNTYYNVGRYTTEAHRETLKINGWDFCPVDIMDEDGTVMLPVRGGKHFTEMSMGKNIVNYDSMLVLTHFKGHTMGGFGGSMKNIAIGNADGRIGKAMIHTGDTGSQWGISKEPFMERMAESAKATIDYFGKRITYINVMRNMSVDCDCAGVEAAPVVTPDVGMLASTDLLAIDQACVDLIYALPAKDRQAMVERIESRKGLRQLSAMRELGMGNPKYELIDIDD